MQKKTFRTLYLLKIEHFTRTAFTGLHAKKDYQIKSFIKFFQLYILFNTL